MLGAIIGDIVGSIYEVKEVNELKNNPNKKRDYEERIKILDKRTPLFTEECSYTDDTVLTIAIADALTTGKDFSSSLREYGLAECNLGQDKYGRSRFGSGFISWLNNEKEGNSFGNGASMRISPVGLFYDDLKFVLSKSKEATIPSHNNEEAIIGAQAVASTIYLARKDFSKAEILDYLESRFGYFMNYDLEDLQRNYMFSSKSKDSVPQAIYCFLKSNSFEDCLRKSLSIGGDTDTIAAISCSIAESFYGIPENLKKQALTYLPQEYKEKIDEFYKLLSLKKELLDLDICNDNFWEYMRTHTKRIHFPINSDIWGTYPDKRIGTTPEDIRILVPCLETEYAYQINIREYANAYSLYSVLQSNIEIDRNNRKNSESFAINKEEEYILKKSYPK
jgi:ADP-ribosylglycohydrolase